MGLLDLFLNAVWSADLFSVKLILSPENKRSRQSSILASFARFMRRLIVSSVTIFLEKSTKKSSY